MIGRSKHTNEGQMKAYSALYPVVFDLSTLVCPNLLNPSILCKWHGQRISGVDVIA